MVPFQGEPLISRTARMLAEAGVKELVVVVGYKKEIVQAELEATSPIPVRFVENARYAETQTFYSLMLTRPYVENAPFLKLNGDVIFEAEIVDRLVSSPNSLALTVDDRVRLDAEAMKVQLDDHGVVRKIGKGLDIARSIGESIGIERLDPPASSKIFDDLEAAAAKGEKSLYYEDVFQRSIDAGRADFHVVPIGGLRWTEIDDEKDLARARSLFGDAVTGVKDLRELESQCDGDATSDADAAE